MASTTKPLFVYINGYPGVGKLTIARALRAILKNAKVFDNHSLIDPISSVFERGMPEYQRLRQNMASCWVAANQKYLLTLSASLDPRFHRYNASGSSAVKDYIVAAHSKGSRMVSVILQCDLEENVRRLTDASRGVHDKKLTDVEILKRIHAEEDIYHFEGELELEINVTKKSPGTVAGEIRDFLDHTR